MKVMKTIAAFTALLSVLYCGTAFSMDSSDVSMRGGEGGDFNRDNFSQDNRNQNYRRNDYPNGSDARSYQRGWENGANNSGNQGGNVYIVPEQQEQQSPYPYYPQN